MAAAEWLRSHYEYHHLLPSHFTITSEPEAKQGGSMVRQRQRVRVIEIPIPIPCHTQATSHHHRPNTLATRNQQYATAPMSTGSDPTSSQPSLSFPLIRCYGRPPNLSPTATATGLNPTETSSCNSGDRNIKHCTTIFMYAT